MSFRDLFRRGVLTNVALHARLERKHDDSERDVKTELRRAGFKKELIVANVKRLEKLVRGLEWKPGATRVVRLQRDDVVRRGRRRAQGGVRARGRAHARVGPRLGHRLQRGTAFAHRRRERALRRRARRRRARSSTASTARSPPRAQTTILPLVADVTDPSPALGWHGLERQTLERARPAGADALPRRAAPRRDRRQRARAGVPVVARGARHRARDRVPDARRPARRVAAHAQEGRRPSRLRSGAVRARARRAVRDRAHGGARRVEHASSITRTRARSASRFREPAVRGAQLLAVSGFALAQPLFDILGKNAEFFAVRGSTPSDIVLFALVVTFVPALVLLAIEVAVELATRRDAARAALRVPRRASARCSACRRSSGAASTRRPC